MIRPFNAACIQSIIHEIRDHRTKDEVIRENINRILSNIDYVTGRFGNSKIIVLPEFSLQGFDHLPGVEDSLKICITIPRPETDMLAEAAVEKGIYIGGNAFEVDPDWPGRWFNTAFLISPEGEVILRYRKIYTGSVAGGATNTSPADVLTEYIDRYGYEGLFPVVDTPLGKIGMLVCFDICFPEVTRALAMRGAEIILHPTGEPYGPQRKSWREAKHTRAFENGAYLLSANHGAYYSQTEGGQWMNSADLMFQERQRNEIAPSMRSHGHSEIIDYYGNVVADVTGSGEAVVQGLIDIEALRYKRSQTGLNLLAISMPQVYAPLYEKTQLRPVDQFADHPIQKRGEGRQVLLDTIDRLQREGTFMAPWDAEPAMAEAKGS